MPVKKFIIPVKRPGKKCNDKNDEARVEIQGSPQNSPGVPETDLAKRKGRNFRDYKDGLARKGGCGFRWSHKLRGVFQFNDLIFFFENLPTQIITSNEKSTIRIKVVSTNLCTRENWVFLFHECHKILGLGSPDPINRVVRHQQNALCTLSTCSMATLTVTSPRLTGHRPRGTPQCRGGYGTGCRWVMGRRVPHIHPPRMWGPKRVGVIGGPAARRQDRRKPGPLRCDGVSWV